MSVCLLHPQNAAAGTCELCAQPHCAACLQGFLGRRYCPACLAHVQAIAAPARPGAPKPGPVAPRSAPGPAPCTGAFAPRFPGWASALLYLLGFVLLVKMGAETVAMLPLLLAKVFSGRYSKAGDDAMQELLDPGGLGYPLWCLLLGIFTWGSLLATLGYTVLMGQHVERKTLPQLGLAWPPRIRADLLSGLTLAGILFVSLVGIGAARGWFVFRGIAPVGQTLLVAIFGFLLLLPYAAVEEIAIRGYFFQAARRSWGTAGALVASSLAFAAFHALNPDFWKHPLAILGLLFAGLYLGMAVLVRGNLWLAIFLHTGWNLMEGPIFGLPVSGIKVPTSVFRTTVEGPELWTGGSFGPEASLSLCILLVVHAAALWAVYTLFPRKTQTPDRQDGQGTTLYRALPVSEN